MCIKLGHSNSLEYFTRREVIVTLEMLNSFLLILEGRCKRYVLIISCASMRTLLPRC